MKVLIVDDDSDIRDILEFTFSCEAEANFIHASSGNEAIKIIKENSDIDIIICDYNMPDGDGGDVYKFLLDHKIDMAYVFCSSELVSDHDEFEDETYLLGEVTKPYLYDGVQRIVQQYNQKNTVSKNTSDYLEVSLELLRKATELPCDIYVGLNNEKILKIFNLGETFLQNEYDKFRKKGIDFLLIKKENAYLFVEQVCLEIEEALLNESQEPEKKVFNSHTVVMSTISHLGLSERVIKMAKRSVDYALETFKNNPKFKKIEQHIFGHPGSYLTSHSVALAYISVALLERTKWDSPETRDKLVLASFLHDATIRHPNFTESSFGEKSELLSLKDHPKKVQEVLKNLKDIPLDLDRILLEHHERPDGSGFPRSLTGSQLHTLSTVFIFSHDIVDLIFKLKVEKKPLTEQMLQSYLKFDDYNIGAFQKCYKAFLEMKIFE